MAAIASWILVFWAAATAATPTAGRAPAPARGGAYDRLDPKRLGEVLRSLHMTELLQDLLGEQPAAASAPGEMSLAEQKVQQAQKEPDPARRDRLLKEALEAYWKLAWGDPASESDRWERCFEARLRLADTFRVMVEPLAIRLMYLQGAAEDRKAVAAMTEEPLKVLRDLKRQVEDTLVNYREDSNKVNFVVFQRAATAMRERIDGVGAYLKLYRGMALPEGLSERKTLLNDVISSLSPYAELEEDLEGKYRANLLIGMAMRELGQHDPAGAKLAAAASEKAPADVRLQALFEMVHNRTGQGKYDQVPGEIELFRKAAVAILGPEGQLRVDVQAALLLDDLYETQASAEKDPPRVKACRSAAQKALLDFLQKYPSPDISEAFLDVVGWKYRDRKDRASLSGIVLVALARTERSRRTEAGLAEALRLLDLASDANDPVSAAAAPYVLRESATLLYAMNRPREAGRRFQRMAALPAADANQAFQAALNAAVCFYNAYQDALKDKTLAPDQAQEVIAATQLLTDRWSAHPDTGPWFFVLGRLLAEKAQGLPPRSPQRIQCLAKAIEALEKTPALLPESGDARFRALEVRLRLLREDPKAADAAAQARALVSKMKGFAQDAKAEIASAKDKDLVEQWGDWGSRAAVGAIQVRYEFLNEPDAAMRDLPAVLADWKGAAVAKEAMDWEIRTLVESADPRKISEAITKVDAFRAQYPQEAEGLIRQVVERIQDRIQAVRLDAQAGGELDRLRKAYLDFSKELYERSMKADPNQAYAARQMYADALWVGGEGELSLKLWQQCAAEDAASLEAKGKAVDEKIESRTRFLPVARRNEKELEAAVQGYLKLLQEKKLDAASGYARIVQDAMTAMRQATDPEEQDRWMATAVDKLGEAYKALAAALKKQTQVDAMNVLGLARAHRLLRHYGEAMKRYNLLAKGIDRQSYGEFYWETQLELCQTAREGFPSDKEQMKRLVQYIQQLRTEEPGMGGRAALFNQIEFEAKKAFE